MSKLVIDMMGSDLGTAMSVDAVIAFQKEHPDCELVVVGKSEELGALSGVKIIPASAVVSMEMGALEVLRMKDSSMVKAVQAVLSEGADGIVSAGSTGAFLSAASLYLKKIPGVSRPALVTSFPNFKAGGFTTILDVGASNANTAAELVQFAEMGCAYARLVNGFANPRVGLLSNGSEEGKGSPEGKEAYAKLVQDPRFHFVGNVEASQVFNGVADVIVTDGYSGNVMLKSIEGTAKAMGGLLKDIFKKNLLSKLGYLCVHKGVSSLKETLNPKKTGGALLLGVNGIVVKAHGNSDAEAFKNAIDLAYLLAEKHLVASLVEGVAHAG